MKHAKDQQNPGTCQVPFDLGGPDTMTFAKEADGTVTLILGGAQGSCKGNKLSACQLIVACDYVSATPGGGSATLQATYKFSHVGFYGYASFFENVPNKPACNVNTNDTGTLK